MLESKFSATYANFLFKIVIVLKNPCYDPNFAKTNSNETKKNAKCFSFFGENILKFITSILVDIKWLEIIDYININIINT
jgi:hypothetical protein